MCYETSIHVSKQAIDKRFNQHTKEMLTHILKEVISKQLKKNGKLSHSHFSEIRIQDSTEFVAPKNLATTFPGYGGVGRESIVQLQLEFELLTGKVTELSYGSARDSDVVEGMKTIDQIPGKALLIRDLGYFSPKAFEEIRKREAYFISRCKPQWSMYEKHDEELVPLTLAEIKKRLQSHTGKYLDLDIYLGSKIHSPVRLIASKLPEEQTQKRLKRKKDNRTHLSELTKESASLNLFVTNVEREVCDAAQIHKLYRLRWQIELIFKTWKSIMQLHKIHSMNAIRFQCVLLIKLIWVMLNWSLLQLLEEKGTCEVSLHKLSRTMTSKVQPLSLKLIQDQEAFFKWLMILLQISWKHHSKEYKKGDESIPDVLKEKCN